MVSLLLLAVKYRTPSTLGVTKKKLYREFHVIYTFPKYLLDISFVVNNKQWIDLTEYLIIHRYAIKVLFEQGT